jgi:hypothetical protein
MGTKAVYAATGLEGSTYEYRLEQTFAGNIIQTYNDSIVVEWGKTAGLFQLGVRETSGYGCNGNWAYLDVELIGNFAEFTKSKYTICGQGGVFVDFNRDSFVSYEWANNSIPPNGYITKPGRYELITTDKNNCQLSSFIEVTQTQMPRISLGPDTMICTPAFTLWARNIENNPEGTIYTWSNGKTGTDEKQVYIDWHDMDINTVYWVKAELDGCATTATVTVLPCVPEEN